MKTTTDTWSGLVGRSLLVILDLSCMFFWTSDTSLGVRLSGTSPDL